MRQLIRLLRYVKPYGLHLVVSVVFMAMVGLLDAFRILLIGPVLDRVLNPSGLGIMGNAFAPPGSRPNDIVLFREPISKHLFYLNDLVPSFMHNPWTMVAFALISSTLIKSVADYLGTYLVNYSGLGMITDLRDSLYNSILRRSVGFFQRHTTGTLISTLINDVEKVQYSLSTVLAEALQQVFILIFTAYFVVALGRKFSWMLLLFIPFIVFSSMRIGRRVRHSTRRGQDKVADIQNILHETITGNRIVKAFSMERWESRRFYQAGKQLFRANMRVVRAAALSSPLMDLIGVIAISFLLLLGRDQIRVGYFTPGTFVGFIFAVFKLYEPVRKFAMFNNNFQQALGASSEIFRFMDAEDDVKEKPDAAVLPAFRDQVRFEGVHFSYANNGEESRDVLHEINLAVRSGEVIALVGSSGAGKSTMVHLLPRFFDVNEGRITIDGHDVRDVTLGSLRRQIGIVTQETILFNDTVRNNIAYGQPDVPQEQVIDAAKAALAHDFIMAMPEGYDTVIGEKGLRLSGGERQRIAIARALLKNAPILILDEATSALDSESESLVQKALVNLMTGRTVFVIAHRLSTVRRADRIIVIENGQIADSGTHDELMSRLGTYRKLYELQFMDADTPVPVADSPS